MSEPTLPEIARQVRQAKLTYLSEAKLQSLHECISAVKSAKIGGDFMEFGVALGGSAICLAKELGDDRRFLGFDVFSMIPAPSERDDESAHKRYSVISAGKSKGIAEDPYYGYVDNLYDKVVQSLRDFGVVVDGEKIQMIRGLFSDSFPKTPFSHVALAHIDCDWYDYVTECLEFVLPRMLPGGRIILDDYNDFAGCKKAVHDFLAKHPDFTMVRTRPHAVISR